MRSHRVKPSTARALFSFGAAFLVTALGTFVVMGPMGLIAASIFLPFVGALAWRAREPQVPLPSADQNRAFIVGQMSRFLGNLEHPTVALAIEIDNHETLQEIYGHGALVRALAMTHSAIEECLTDQDRTVQLEEGRFMSALAPQAPHDTEAMLNTCTRIQHALAHVSRTSGLPVQMTVSIGFAASNKLVRPSAEGLSDAAFVALAEAKRRSPGAIRAFSEAILARRSKHQEIAQDARDGFERGEIFAYFQPQIDLRTGALSGFEALTRWHHPQRGIIKPDEYLPTLEHAGLMHSLNDTMLRQALCAVRFWDKSGLHVPTVGVNFSTTELRDPRLVERIALLLDAENLEPQRLCVEVLETVVAAQKDDDVTGNLAALADLGCRIDLDDFGTGYASISNITRFSVGRIKIDRSFVAGIDRDTEQQDMVSAMLTMADRLRVRAIAEGVETAAERGTLARIGCHDAQGFQIARPMPIEETVEWASAYFARANEPIQFTRRAS